MEDVVDVGPVAFDVAVVVEGEGFIGEDIEGPLPGHHVGAAVGAVDVEEAGDSGGDFVEVVEAVGDEFHGAFGGGIGGEGAVGGSGFEEGDGGGGAVDGAGRGDDETGGRRVRFCRGLAGGVEEVHGALHVDLAVDQRVLHRVAHGGHGGEVGEGVGFVLRKC